MSTKTFIAFQYLLPQRWLTVVLSHLMNVKKPLWFKSLLIQWFIKQYKIDPSMAANTDLASYPSFNDFFIRTLKSESRPLANTKIMSPVDGTISQIGIIQTGTLIQAKGITYTVEDLLTPQSQLAFHFQTGLFTTLYLAPKDYHRVHMPLAGRLIQTIYVPGNLFSVNQITAENVVNLFARNERLICEFETEIGRVVMIFVGALFVAGIHTTWSSDVKRSKEIVITDYREKNIVLEKGAEAGYFKFGSTIILLLPENQVAWDKPLTAGQAIVMGQALSNT
jgi:phosphatidylserine decarboxylase